MERSLSWESFNLLWIPEIRYNYDFQKSQPLILIKRIRADYLFKFISYNFNQPQWNFDAMVPLIQVSNRFVTFTVHDGQSSGTQ